MEPVEINEECVNEGQGIKVLSEIPVINEKNLECGAQNKGNGETEMFPGVLVL
jgi:hypothetical protein